MHVNREFKKQKYYTRWLGFMCAKDWWSIQKSSWFLSTDFFRLSAFGRSKWAQEAGIIPTKYTPWFSYWSSFLNQSWPWASKSSSIMLRVQIMIMDVSLEPANPCRFDYFELEEGAPRRRRFCIWVTFGTWTFCQQEEPWEVLSRFRLWHNYWVRREYCQRQVGNKFAFIIIFSTFEHAQVPNGLQCDGSRVPHPIQHSLRHRSDRACRCHWESQLPQTLPA